MLGQYISLIIDNLRRKKYGDCAIYARKALQEIESGCEISPKLNKDELLKKLSRLASYSKNNESKDATIGG